MLYWYPKIKDLDIHQPRTEIIPAQVVSEEDWISFIDTGKPCFDLERVKRACREIGYPVFVRTDQASGKHDWKNTCFIESQDKLVGNLRRIVEFSFMADILGLSIQAIVVRQYIPMVNLFTAFYGDLPINPEIRCFIEAGLVRCWHWYWIKEAIAESKPPSVKNWERILAMTQRTLRTTDLEEVLVGAKKVADRFTDDGYWSVDFCKSQAGPWILIDMAEGERSWHDSTCIKED
jgi:hypothetical protein